MATQLQQRAYRKASNLEGWVYLGGKIRKITVKNISLSGAFVLLDPESVDDHQQTLKRLSVSKTLDFFLSSWGISGIAEIIRIVITERGQLSFAMAFQDLNHSADKPSFNRKNYRAEIAIPGQLLLNGYYFDFMTVNMSVDGLMIRLPIVFGVEEGMTVTFKFPQANLKGLATVVWTLDNEDDETLIGLQFIKSDQQLVAEKEPVELFDIDFVAIDQWLNGISLSSCKPLVAEKKPVKLSDIHFELIDQLPSDTLPAFSQPASAERKPVALFDIDAEAIDQWLNGISLSSYKQVFAETKPAKLSDIHFELIDELPGDTLPASASPPAFLFCGKNWTDRLSAPQKMRQW